MMSPSNGNIDVTKLDEAETRAQNAENHAPSPGWHDAWRCQANVANTAGGNDPQDCGWPLCGCDPYADKVIETLNESGFYVVPIEPMKEMIDAAIAMKVDRIKRLDLSPAGMEEAIREDYKAMVERSQKP